MAPPARSLPQPRRLLRGNPVVGR